ncbi:MAG: trehalose-6-phosphate synthase [Desulfohalobiaceae bacterium]|nr:trehalose-6-phosphate synthase [Desulfohalobiaceae bacterium]
MDCRNSHDDCLVIVSNRLPLVLKKDEAGEIKTEMGAGGLVTALAPVLKNRGGIWIGWPGYVQEEDIQAEPILTRESDRLGYALRPVQLTRQELDDYYEGFSNSVLWPLFHDFLGYCRFHQQYWDAYQRVNNRFAEVIAANIGQNDLVWVHDYHLLLVAAKLREKGARNRMAFFLHTPFPALDIFIRLPWRFKVLSSLLEFDLLGFHTVGDRRNFIGCLRKLVREVEIGQQAETEEGLCELRMNGRVIKLGVFPISIDYREFSDLAAAKDISERVKDIHENFPDKKNIFSVGRLDYTKGIPEGLRAFRKFLTLFPEMHRKVRFIQVVVPSREDIPAYAALKEEIERLVGEINGVFSQEDWMPVQYVYRHLDRRELVSFYRACEVALVTPLKDGMNLIAKEYCASNIKEDGVLILSEFAGAVNQLHEGALLVNPHDTESVASSMHQALFMDLAEKRRRMQGLRRCVQEQDIFWWVNYSLQAAIEKDLSSFPRIQEYYPAE